MAIQRLLLRLTLGFLAAAALAAVAAVVSGSTAVLWRIVGTCIEASLATAVVLRLSRLVDDEDQRPAAMTGFAALLVCFALCLMATWLDLLGLRQNGKFVGSALLTAALGTVCTGALFMRTQPAWVSASRAIAIAAATTLVSGLLAIWTEQPKLGGATAAAGPLLILACVGLVAQSLRERPWRLVGSALAVAAAAIGVKQSTARIPSVELWNWYASLTATSIAIAHANLLLLLQLPRPWHMVRLLTIAFAASCAIGISLSAIGMGELAWQLMEEPVGRITAAAAILAACGTLGLVVRQKLGRRARPDSVKSVFTVMEVVCPRCCTKQSAPAGDSPCINCRMILSIQVREPRCNACGYCLFDLAEDVCPECGNTIPSRGQPIGATTPA